VFQIGKNNPVSKQEINLAILTYILLSVIYLTGIRLEKTLTKQIKCLILNLITMRSIYTTLIGLIFSLSVFSQSSFDTTYTKEWNAKTESWTYFDRVISAFDSDLLLSELVQVYENDTWINYNLITFNYSNAQVVEELENFWDIKNQDWVRSYRKLYSYSNGKLSQVLHQYVFNDVYVNSQREVLKYTEDGQLVEKVVQTFEEAWTNFLKYQYYYNSNDLIFEENLTYWENENWGDEGFSVNYTYDERTNVVSKVKSKITGGEKKNLLQEEFIYNENGRLDNHLMSHWNGLGNKWVNKNRAVYVNDMNGYIVSMLNQSKNKKEWVNYLYTDFRGDNDPITGMDIADGMTFSIYPVNYGKKAMIEFDNPFDETFFVKVMDQNGRLIGSATTNNNEVAIDARKMIKGLYYVELQGRNSFSGSFSIE